MNKFKYIKVLNNRQIRYLSKDYRDNLYIVFLHGFMSSIEGEKPKTILKFAKKNKLGFLALEYSGHGKSSGKFTKGNITQWSKEVETVIKKIVKKNKIDIVLNAIESHQNYFKTSKTFYFPNAYPSDLISPIDGIDKNTFLGFCGSLLNRSEILDKLENKFGLKKDIWKLGNEMIKTINGYKIHFNKTLSNDINYRIFETMGCNTLILTNHTENINTFFNDMENIVIYNNETELFEKLKSLK